MSTTDIRVRPVIRHVVTRFQSDGARSGSEAMGEFGNEQYAEEVAEALRQKHAPKQYIAVERGWEIATNVLYFTTRAEADTFVETALKEDREFRVYEREPTGPIERFTAEQGIPAPAPELRAVPPRIWHKPGATPEEKLADIPNLLRTIATQIDAGQFPAVSGVVTLKCAGKRTPEVFGLGAEIDPIAELQSAAKALAGLGIR
jgi:hypothetical protein